MNNKTNNYLRRKLMYVGLLSFIPTFNIFFSLFVWYKEDLSPNQAIGCVSLFFMGWILYNWIKDRKEFYAHKRIKRNIIERGCKNNGKRK